MSQWLSELVARRKAVLALHLLLVAVALPGISRLELDNSPRAFAARDGELRARYDRFRLLFGRDQSLRLVFGGEQLWSPQGLSWLAETEQRIEGLQGVVGSAGLHRRYSRRWRDLTATPRASQTFRRQVTGDRVNRAFGWVDPEGTTVTSMVLLYDLPAPEIRALLAAVDAAVSEPPEGVEAFAVGFPTVSDRLDQKVRGVLLRVYPLLVLAAMSILITALRNRTAIVVVLTQVGFLAALLFGLMGWAGQSLDFVQIIVGPILFVVALANAVYLWTEYARQLRHSEKSGPGTRTATRVLQRTYDERAWAVLWAGVTTTAGFASLTFSESPAIRTLGIWTALGLGLATIEAFLLFPTLLSVVRPAPGDSLRLTQFGRWGRSLARTSITRSRLVIGLFALAAGVAVGGLLQLRFGGSFLDYFSPTSELRRQIDAVEALGIGAVNADLVLVAGGSAASRAFDFRSPEGLERLGRLTDELATQPKVLGAVSAMQLVRAQQLDEEDVRLDTRGALESLLIDDASGLLLNSAVTRNGAAARVSLAVPLAAREDLVPTFLSAVDSARRHFPEIDEIWLTGLFPLILESQRSLGSAMLHSLTATFLIVTLVFSVLTRDPLLAGALIVANLLPVGAALGAMGWLGLPLDSTTLMVAAVVLGLAVDDTLHTLGAFRRRAPALGAKRAAVQAIARTAPGHLTTTAILSSGFALCALSGFAPVARFGLLVAFGMLVALITDLTLVPVLLARQRSKRHSAP